MVSWYDYLEIYQVSDTELHLYSGRPGRPRSQLTIVREDVLDEPIRTPSLSEEAILQRYGKSELNLDQLSLRIQMNLIILLPEKLMDNSYRKQLIDQETESFFKIDSNTNFVEGKYPILPKLTEIDRDNSPEYEHYFRVITRPCTHSRQRALTSLLKEDTGVSRHLAYWLLEVRPEITASVIREFGRLELPDKYILTRCKNEFLLSEFRGVVRYSFWYLYNYDRATLLSHEKYLDLRHKAKQFAQLPYTTVWSRISQAYNALPIRQSMALEAISFLDDIDQEKLFQIATLHLHNLKLEKSRAKSIRRALITILKQVEMVHNPNLLAVVSAISLMGQRCEISGEEFTYKLGPIGFEMKYVQRRINSLLQIWEFNQKKDRTQEYLSRLLLLHPPLSVDTQEKVDADWAFDQWTEHHPILKYHHDHISEILTDSKFLSALLVQLGEFPNQILSNYVEATVKKNKDATSGIIEKPIQKFMITRVSYISTSSVQVDPQTTIIDHIIQIRSDKFIADLIDFSVSRHLILSRPIIEEYLGRIFKGRDIDSNLMILYLSSNQDKMELVEVFLEILFSKIEDYFDRDVSLEAVEELLIKQIVNLKSILRSIPQSIDYKIDALKILYKEEIEEFDLENWQPLPVETIVAVYKYSNGGIPFFVEGTITYAFSKPDWDQLARHYLAMGIQRPKRELIAKSQLKRVPNHLIRDILGQIALVNQTIAYCERNGFTEPLENLIIQNIYTRGWNIERRLERTIASLFGSISPRIRSYFAAYLVIERGEVNEDILELARDVENYQLRDRIIRSMERYGTPEMWFTMAESYHLDMRERAIQQIRESRMSAKQRSQIIRELINASRIPLRELGRKWLAEFGLQKEDMVSLLYNPYIDCWKDILEYLSTHIIDYKQEYDNLMANFLSRILWHPDSKKEVRNKAVSLIGIIQQTKIKENLKDLLANLSLVSIKSRAGDAIEAYNQLEEAI